MLEATHDGAQTVGFSPSVRMHQPARRLFLALGLAITTIAGGLGAAVPAQAQPRFVMTESKYAAIVLDAKTGEVLYAKNEDSSRYPASITKIMTLYLTFEALSTGRLKPTDTLVVSAHAANMAPSRLGLRPGETISVDEAMRAIAVKSANDMAVALAEKIGGSESRFAALMTLRAQELGMTNTHYVNASGLPDVRQISTARDIATLSRAVMRDYPQYYGYFSLHQFAYHGEVMTNHNGLLNRMQGVDGLKTGYINASGFNLAASAVRNNNRLIAVVLGGNSTAARDEHVEDLLDIGFDVMRRRDLGERVTIAQLMDSPDPIGPVMRPATEQGSGDQAGLQIVLTNTELASLHAAEELSTQPAPKAAAQRRADPDQQAANDAPSPAKLILAKADTHGVSEHARDAAKKRGHGDFIVQVGAFHRKADANEQLSKMSHKFAGQFDDAKSEIGGLDHGYYRARFVGMSASDAKEACRVLDAHHETCKVMSAD
jgi:D-alanyl-D-alanine carboxypeptidase